MHSPNSEIGNVSCLYEPQKFWSFTDFRLKFGTLVRVSIYFKGKILKWTKLIREGQPSWRYALLALISNAENYLVFFKKAYQPKLTRYCQFFFFLSFVDQFKSML